MGFIICRRKIYDNSNKGWEGGEQNQYKFLSPQEKGYNNN